jgi:hypothetical protein
MAGELSFAQISDSHMGFNKYRPRRLAWKLEGQRLKEHPTHAFGARMSIEPVDLDSVAHPQEDTAQKEGRVYPDTLADRGCARRGCDGDWPPWQLSEPSQWAG